jgi:hypothetical protein
MTKLAFVDTETTGLHPDYHQIWEVALLLEDQGTTTEHVWQLPVDLGRADPMALGIGRFHERRTVAEALSAPSTFAREFSHLTAGAHLVGAVISFDEERLRRLLRREHQCPTWHYHLVDVEALAAGRVAADAYVESAVIVDLADGSTVRVDGRPPWKSDHLSRAIGVDPDDFDRHSALGDARWARAIYQAVMG